MKSLLISSLVLIAAATSTHAKTGWDDDFGKSLVKAAEENKMVLLDFTGSDWCGYCIKLDDEVFSKSAFKKFAKDNLILVELDFPHGKTLPRKTKTQNDELKAKFKIQGYPTIVLLDGEGKEVARWVGYNPELLAHLQEKLTALKPKAE